MTSKRDRRPRGALEDFMASEKESRIPLSAGGHDFDVDPPTIWSDEVMELGAVEDVVGMARKIMGDDTYKLWVESGGSATRLLAMIKESEGLSVPESSASSDS